MRVDGGINNTQARNTTNLEFGVQDSHRIVISANRAGTRGVVFPGTILDVVLDIFLGGDVLAGEDLSYLDCLAVKSITGQFDGLIQRLQISFVVANARVKVVEGDVWDIERGRGAEGDSAGVVTRVSLEDGPGKPVVPISCIDTVVREIITEVDRSTEGKDIEAIIGGNGALVEHGSRETGRRVDAAVTED